MAASKSPASPATPIVAASTAISADQSKPTKPDEETYLKELAAAQREHEDAMARLNAVKAKLDLAVPNRSQPSPAQQRKQDLLEEASEIRLKQAGDKSERLSKHEQIKKLDEQLRARLADQKIARAKVPFKTVEELNAKIHQLEADVNSGRMKLVDEKRNLAEISSLRKLLRFYSQLEDNQKQMDDLRAKIKVVKDGMDTPEQKALRDRYNTNQAEINAIKNESEEAFKGLSSLRDERTRLQAEQQDCYTAIRRIKDDHYNRKKAFVAWEREVTGRARQRQREERERQVRERRHAEAQLVLADASVPAYSDEIRRAIALIQFLAPSHPAATALKAPLLADLGLSAQPSRTVDDSGLTGVRLVRKQDREVEEYVPAKRPGGKKKNRNHTNADAASALPWSGPSAKVFNCPPSMISDCAYLGVDTPMSSADVQDVIAQVVAKLEHWKADQAAQTQRNIEKAKKDIKRLERDGTTTDAVDSPREPCSPREPDSPRKLVRPPESDSLLEPDSPRGPPGPREADDVTTDELTDEVMPDDVTTNEVTTNDGTTNDVTTNDVTTDDVTTDVVTTDDVTTDDVTTDLQKTTITGSPQLSTPTTAEILGAASISVVQNEVAAH